MKHWNMILLIATLTVVLLAFVSYSLEEIQVVDNSAFENPKRSPSIFSHDFHNENIGIDECNACHHVYNNGILRADESSEDQMCAECHPVVSLGKELPLMKAFHQRCKSCHIEQQGGPVMCGQCHPRQWKSNT